jgi:HSP20 family molecular chaperone IbpA
MTMAEQNVVTRSGNGNVERDRNHQGWIVPPVDIFEDDDAVTLIADVPGMSNDRLRVAIDHEVLTLEGEADIEMPDGIEAVLVDTPHARYRRTFTLSGDLDTGEVSAVLKDGVVTVRIPKRAEAKPRRIEVKAA